MSRKIYNKLIRDKILEVIESRGHIPKFSVMNESDFREALKTKMKEETKELMKAKTKDDALNELSDIQELFIAIAKNHELSMDEIEEKRNYKKGAVLKKSFCLNMLMKNNFLKSYG